RRGHRRSGRAESAEQQRKLTARRVRCRSNDGRGALRSNPMQRLSCCATLLVVLVGGALVNQAAAQDRDTAGPAPAPQSVPPAVSQNPSLPPLQLSPERDAAAEALHLRQVQAPSASRQSDDAQDRRHVSGVLAPRSSRHVSAAHRAALCSDVRKEDYGFLCLSCTTRSAW